MPHIVTIRDVTNRKRDEEAVRGERSAISVRGRIEHDRSCFRRHSQRRDYRRGPVEDVKEQTASAGQATVLLVDDEPSIRAFIGAVLRRQGYRVLTATAERDAPAVRERESGSIEAVILDIVMPVMGAKDLLPALRARQPGVRILLTSGHSEAEARRLSAVYPGAAFIQKPYAAQQIAKPVEERLGASGQ